MYPLHLYPIFHGAPLKWHYRMRPGLETRFFPLTAVKEVCDESAIARCEESLPSFTGKLASVRSRSSVPEPIDLGFCRLCVAVSDRPCAIEPDMADAVKTMLEAMRLFRWAPPPLPMRCIDASCSLDLGVRMSNFLLLYRNTPVYHFSFCAPTLPADADDSPEEGGEEGAAADGGEDAPPAEGGKLPHVIVNM
jgi:hypothetical protein